MSTENNEPIYFTKLEINNVFCFKQKSEISFLDKNGKPALFTVILGNNNTGKTTILRTLASPKLHNSYQQALTIYSDLGSSTPLENSTLALAIYNPPKSPIRNLGNLHLSKYPNKISFSLNGYGVSRKLGILIPYKPLNKIITRDFGTITLFEENGAPYLINTDSWFNYVFSKLGEAYLNKQDDKLKIIEKQFNTTKHIVNTIFAAAEQSEEKDIISFENSEVFFKTALGDKVRLSELGSGYQSLLTWVLDLAYRMFMRYPESDNPIAEPAIVLVDELDLHLHPEWQRRVVGFLRKLFPKTQFIVTAHSPLVVQSSPKREPDDSNQEPDTNLEMNVIILQKNLKTQSVDIIDANDKFGTDTFEGWSLEAILKELMMENSQNLYSKKMLTLLQNFNAALQEKNRDKAEIILNEVEEIIEPNSTLTETLRIRLTRLPKKSPL